MNDIKMHNIISLRIFHCYSGKWLERFSTKIKALQLIFKKKPYSDTMIYFKTGNKTFHQY